MKTTEEHRNVVRQVADYAFANAIPLLKGIAFADIWNKELDTEFQNNIILPRFRTTC